MKIYKRKQIIERITLIGPIEKMKAWIEWCYDNGYRVIRSGPKLIGVGRCDSTKFKIVAEKETK